MSNQKIKNILCVDDEGDIQAILSISLIKRGDYNLKFCYNGTEALEAIKEFQPDIILLDVMMPGMDGITALTELRKIKSLANVPIVFVTAKAQPDEIKKYQELGVTAVIVKPFDVIALPQQLEDIMSQFALESSRSDA